MKTVELTLKESDEKIHINPDHVAEITELKPPTIFRDGTTEIKMSDGTIHVINNGIETNKERLKEK